MGAAVFPLLIAGFILTMLAATLTPEPHRARLGWLGVSLAILAGALTRWPG